MLEKTIERFFGTIRELNAEGFAENFAEHATLTDPVGSAAVQGKANVRAHFSEITARFKKIDLRADKVFICGLQAAVFFKGSGVGKNGKTVTLEGIDVMECDKAGKITQLKGYWNPAPALEALAKA